MPAEEVLMGSYEYVPATAKQLARLWEKDIAAHRGDARWPAWALEYKADNESGRCKTFAVLYSGEPVGQGTLLFSPDCGAVSGRHTLADGKKAANIDALRIEKAHEGKGQISKLVKVMEQYAASAGYTTLTIGVAKNERRSAAIYRHWGYTGLIHRAQAGGETVLYYAKALSR